jgi:hypothetical protein
MLRSTAPRPPASGFTSRQSAIIRASAYRTARDACTQAAWLRGSDQATGGIHQPNQGWHTARTRVPTSRSSVVLARGVLCLGSATRAQRRQVRTMCVAARMDIRLIPRPAPSGIAGLLFDLADAVRRLPPPGHRDPEAFHIAKSDLAAELRHVAIDAEHRLPD